MTIPARAHFCWVGPDLPWAYAFAVISAARRGGMENVILHHTDDLEGEAVRAVAREPGVRLSQVDPESCLDEAGGRLGLGDSLARLYRGLESRVMRSDILRAAILHREGGIYLDLDTLTVASLRPLLDARQFVGTEFIVWPRAVRDSRSPLVLGRAAALDVARKLLRRLPRGWAAFRHLEPYCHRGLTNGAMGAAPEAPLLAAYLRAMPRAAVDRHAGPYALGPDLLQEVVPAHSGKDLILHHPHVFYPLPPEISAHWFRMSGASRLDAVLAAETRVAHWYASVHTRPEVARISPDYVRRHRDGQLYSALAASCLPELAAARASMPEESAGMAGLSP